MSNMHKIHHKIAYDSSSSTNSSSKDSSNKHKWWDEAKGKGRTSDKHQIKKQFTYSFQISVGARIGKLVPDSN
jgi:hypothetical protein